MTSRQRLLNVLDRAAVTLRRLESYVPAPRLVRFDQGSAYRYIEQTPQQALLQKLARLISGVFALDLLLINGFIQEQAALQRMNDELLEGVTFLALGLITGKWTKDHARYLEAFWQEESADPDATPRDIVKMSKIRAYNHRACDLLDPSTADRNGRLLYRTYSGYVHAASPQVMEMYIGEPPHFVVRGLKQSPLYADHVADIINYFFRAVSACYTAAQAIGASEVAKDAYAQVRLFQGDFAEALYPGGIPPPRRAG